MNMWFNTHRCFQWPPVSAHSPWTISHFKHYSLLFYILIFLYPYFYSISLFYISVTSEHTDFVSSGSQETALLMVDKATRIQLMKYLYTDSIQGHEFIRKLWTVVSSPPFQFMEGARSSCTFSQSILLVARKSWPFTASLSDLFSGTEAVGGLEVELQRTTITTRM